MSRFNSGSPLEHEYELEVAELQRRFKPWADSLGRLNVKTIKDFTNKDALKTAQANAEKFHPQFNKIELDFIHAHADSYVSFDMLENEARVIQYPDDFYNCYMLLSDHLKKTPEGRLMGERAMLAVKYAIGKPALDFTQIDSKGHNVSLASLKGKYILIDFWASWCGPCRAEYPFLKKAYQQFKEKGFEIVGVSLDNDKTAWLNAIKDNGFDWPEVCDLKGRKNEIALAYGVTGIPASFLVDPTGKIIAKNLHGDDLIQKLNEEIIKTN
jgi:peroxiredoxin